MVSFIGNRFSDRIDTRLAKVIGGRLVGFRAYSKEFPSYRFIDLYNAVEDFGRPRSNVISIQSEHQEDPNGILNKTPERCMSRSSA
jgi:hypothetical protein